METDREPIAVFGSSEPTDGDEAYARARELGGLLARAGHRVVTGGYGGVMEAASRGAREAGGIAIGVVSSVFASRRPNPYLSRVIETPDLFERQRRLVEESRGFIVLPGKSGTLSELTLVWALHRAGSLPASPVVLLGGAWAHLLRHLVAGVMIEDEQLAVTRVVDTPAEAVDAVDAFLAGRS